MYGDYILWWWIQQLFCDARVPEGCRGLLLDELPPRLSLDDLELDWSGGTFSRVSDSKRRMLTRRFSLGHSPIFQPTGQIMSLPYVDRFVFKALCLQTSVRIHRLMVNS
jgi:hypothetical protein